MAHRYDPDLEFFQELSDKELDSLVNILTWDKNTNPHWVEYTKSCETYKKYAPDHSYYWKGIAEGLQFCAINPSIDEIERKEGKLYKEILYDVCDELEINYDQNSSVTLIERNLLLNVLQRLLGMPSTLILFFRTDTGLSEEQEQQLESSQNVLPILSELFDTNNIVIWQKLLNTMSNVLCAKSEDELSLSNHYSSLMESMSLMLEEEYSKSHSMHFQCHVALSIVIQVASLRRIQECYASMKSEPTKIITMLEQLLQKKENIFEIGLGKIKPLGDMDFKRASSLIQYAENWHHKDQELLMSSILYSSGVAGWRNIEYDDPAVIFTLAESKGLRDIYSQTSLLYPESPKSDEIKYVITLAEQKALRLENPIYNFNQQPSVEFKDFGFKLAVINELMYCQDKLKPRFYKSLFFDEYQEYSINPYSRFFYNHNLLHSRTPYHSKSIDELMLPEIKYYLYTIDIPQILLNRITNLKIKKNTELYTESIYYWCVVSRHLLSNAKSNLITINENVIADLALLPNLECIYISESATVPEEFIEAVKVRNISLIIENEEGAMVETIYQRK